MRKKIFTVQGQQGFSLLEVSVVTAIMTLLTIIAVPVISTYLIENRTPKVAEELARFMIHNQVSTLEGQEHPYASMGQQSLLAFVVPGSLLSIGSDQRVLHGLGAQGQVQISPLNAGTSYNLTLDKVHAVACPGLASVLQRLAQRMVVTASGAQAVVLKDEAGGFNALLARQACSKGPSNTFVLTVE